MIDPRRSDERGRSDYGWLDSRHTFSFAGYMDPAHMGFRQLRVINEDRVHPGRGFGAHDHRNMEIISYVVSGALRHRDSMGNGSVIRPGEVQLMSAGTGVTHSEMNASENEPVHFLQIWILPRTSGGPPRYLQKAFAPERRAGRLCLLASPDGADGSLSIQQDVRLFGTTLEGGEQVTHTLAPGRHAWVQLVHGAVTIGGTSLVAGDGAAVSEETEITLVSSDRAEALLFDLA
jgi:redox-sensitive bicupin YhaK (pirin superfamily)